MTEMRTLICLSLLFLLGCSAASSKDGGDAGTEMADGGLSCEAASEVVVERTGSLPTACSDEAECEVTQFHLCDCYKAHTALDDPELEAARGVYGDCPVTGCEGREACRWDGFGGGALLRAACIDSVCTPVPQPDCGMLFESRPAPTSCDTAADCEVRTDINACGCPEALHVEDAKILALVVERMGCPVPEECQLVDCLPATIATCEAGVCVLQ